MHGAADGRLLEALSELRASHQLPGRAAVHPVLRLVL